MADESCARCGVCGRLIRLISGTLRLVEHGNHGSKSRCAGSLKVAPTEQAAPMPREPRA